MFALDAETLIPSLAGYCENLGHSPVFLWMPFSLSLFPAANLARGSLTKWK